ncbi:transcriptional regulator [Achromobacter spanius]|uniref:transcriptional regulator n=1 Tax=Achromobacter spanius TaxID=217203 RepID=UPI0038012DE3
METRVPYGAPAIRPECLRPFADGWQQPESGEVRAVLSMAGLTGGEAAKLLGISDGRTIRRWTGGDSPIPFAAWAILCEVAGLGVIWAKPQQ